MLFCEYPFERPQDAKDHRRYALVLDRVMNVNYKIPEGSNLAFHPACLICSCCLIGLSLLHLDVKLSTANHEPISVADLMPIHAQNPGLTCSLSVQAFQSVMSAKTYYQRYW